MQHNTKTGLLLILVGLIISIIGSFIFGLYQFIFPIEKVEDVFQYIPLSFVSGIGGIISFIGAILFFIGRKEFGSKHQQFVMYALVCIVLGIILSVIISVGGTFMAIMSAQNGDFSGFPSIIWVVPTVIGAITGGLGYVFALYHLEDKNGRMVLYIAFIVSIAISIVLSFFISGAVEELIDEAIASGSSQDFTSISPFISSINQYTILGVISSILWAIAVYLPYKRIKEGELVPQSQHDGQVPDRICPNCNRSIPTDAKTCPYCGKSFDMYV